MVNRGQARGLGVGLGLEKTTRQARMTRNHVMVAERKGCQVIVMCMLRVCTAVVARICNRDRRTKGLCQFINLSF